MDVISSKLGARGNISTRLKQISAYADIIITGRTKQLMIDTFTKLKNKASKYGLLIKENKTKRMKCTRKQLKENKLETDTTSFESIQSIKYLGSTVNQSYTIAEEIKERLIAGNTAFYANQKVLHSKLLSRKSKLKLYWTLIRPVVMYTGETWVLK
jgi:hypothetical protein